MKHFSSVYFNNLICHLTKINNFTIDIKALTKRRLDQSDKEIGTYFAD